ncbi:hypothetical protein D9619_008009 [Psilocybe cf. subviscida]|uniref:SANT domain-containing protein n=1 Tax=Psilocybe cf. subviscida TaxID=2480587 RepID=A0A8H5ESX0_9AGAR|nr:hypothetical protein D9619_008009 [Psilocybe cf. subviscida]
MSAGGYDGPRMSSDFARQQKQPPIRSSIPNRLPPAPPPPSRMPYDRRYAPDIALREGMSSVHRPNSYRPDYSAGKYYPRSSSPDPYSAPPRHPEHDHWNRNNNVWRPPPSPMDSPNVWPERKPIPPSPTNSVIGRGSRDDPSSRSFEPSASWVNSRGDRSIRSDNSPSSDMYSRRGKGSIERSPEQSIRVERAPVYPSGDRYVPTYNTARRDSFTSSRPGYDSYRPTPSDHGWSAPSRREPISPASSHHRRDSGSYTARSLSRHDSPRSSQAAPSKPSPAPLPASSSTQSSSTQSKPASESWNYVTTRVKHTLPPRPPSRSSIASTQVSERRSPVPTPTPPSASASTPASAPSPQIQTEATQKSSPHPAATSSALLTNVQPPPANTLGTTSGEKVLTHSGVEHTVPEQNGMDVDTKDVSHDPVVPITVSPTGKQPSSDSEIPTVAPENVPEEPTRHEDLQEAPSQEAMEQGIPAERPDVLTSRPMSPLIIPTVSPANESILEDKEPLAIVQPKPSYPAIPPINSVEPAPADDIPSTTHSPIPQVHSPVITDNIKPTPTPPVDIPNPEDIPQISELRTAQDALRMVVMTRLVYDRQSREQRVNPVLMANLSIAVPMEVQPLANPEALLEKMSTGQALEHKMESFIRTRPKLASYLRQRHGMVEQKIARLRKEYKVLQDRWDVHCNKLNEQQKTLASEHEMQHSGRTTRRSTAITDAVRSDFEMEQIIASLGVDDATDPNCLSARNTAKIPDMISVVNGQIDYVFDDTAHRVENPAEYYAPKTGIHDWTDQEKRIFVEKFAAYPKQFGIIADFIENKTAAQCVDYYYLHKHQFIDFRKVVSQFAGNKRRRRGTGKKKGNGLLADIAIHDMEVRGGAAAAAAAAGSLSASISTRAPRGRKTHPPTELRKPSSRRNAVQFEDTPTSTPTPEPEAARTRRRRTVPSTPLASTPVVATPEPEPSTPAGGSVQQDDNLDELDTRPAKRPRRAKKIKSAATVEDTSPGPEGHVPLPGRPKKDKGPAVWTDHDKKMFVKLLAQYGDNFTRISELLPPKTPVQCNNYFANHKYELGFDTIIAKAPKRSPSPASKTRLEQTPSAPTTAPSEAPKAKVPLPGKRSTQNQSANTESSSLQPSPAVTNKQTSRQRATASTSSAPVMARLDRPSAEKRPSGYPFPHNAGSRDFADDGYPYSAKAPTYAAMYPPAAVPPETRPGYRPTTPVNSAPSDTPNIIHSPTGMSPPRPAPPPIPTMTQPYLPAHMHFNEQPHHGYYPVANPSWPVQPQRYFDPNMFAAAVGNGMHAPPSASTPGSGPGPTSGSPPVSADGRMASAPGAGGYPNQRPPGNPYPGYALAPPPGMLPPHGARQQQPQQALPPPPVPYPPPPPAHSPTSAAAAATRPMSQYYPGWSTMQ